ncbi:MAG: hypothetical protein AB8G05_00065 [Oligoflexales bacterium]
MSCLVKIAAGLMLLSSFWGCRTQRKISEYRPPACIRGKRILKCSGLDDFNGLNVIEGELGDEPKFEGVKLFLNQSLKKFCTGVFVKKNIMVAPAQCFLAKPSYQNEIFLVKIKSLSKERDVRLKIVSVPIKVVINPAYKQAVNQFGARSIKALAFDLAIVVFRESIVSKSKTFDLINRPIQKSSTLTWIGHGLPGVWASSELWRRRTQVTVADSKYDSSLIEVDYSVRVTDQMQADKANLPATPGSILLSGNKAVGLFVGFSFQKYAFIIETNKRLLFASFNNAINQEFLKEAIAENLLLLRSS